MVIYDVVIIGGGLAGATLARQLKLEMPQVQIAVIEKQKYPVQEAAFKVGESSVEIGAHYFADRLGLKEHIDEHQLPKFGLRYFFPSDGNHDVSQRFEIGQSDTATVPSYQLDRGRFENYINEKNLELGVDFFNQSSARDINVISNQGESPSSDLHELNVYREGQVEALKTKWLIDASGRSGLLKRKLGLKEAVDHNNSACWFRVDKEIDIDSWSDNQQWRERVKVGRRLSTNHLMGEGYWVWLIPLASGSTSVGIVIDSKLYDFSEINRFDRALNWLYKYEPQCAAVIDSLQDKLQDFRILKKYSYGCRQVYSSDRWCITGEAAAFTDPFYSPGSDFIAIGNEYIVDLIKRDSNGEDISERSQIYNRRYLYLYESVMRFYDGFYQYFGHSYIMMQKILWDTAVYLGVTCLLFFNNKFCDLEFLTEIDSDLSKYNHLLFKVSNYFREEARNCTVDIKHGFLDLTKTFLYGVDLNDELTESYSPEALVHKLRKNIDSLEELSGEILAGKNVVKGFDLKKYSSDPVCV